MLLNNNKEGWTFAGELGSSCSTFLGGDDDDDAARGDGVVAFLVAGRGVVIEVVVTGAT